MDDAGGDDDQKPVAAVTGKDARYPLEVEYCTCGLPSEYCEFLPEAERAGCRYWSGGGAGSRADAKGNGDGATAGVSSQAGDAEGADGGPAAAVAVQRVTGGMERLAVHEPSAAASTPGSGGRQPKRSPPPPSAAQVDIQLVKVKGNKQVTVVHGLGAFRERVTLKEFAKACKRRFGCGATVSQTAEQQEVVEVQGDHLHYRGSRVRVAGAVFVPAAAALEAAAAAAWVLGAARERLCRGCVAVEADAAPVRRLDGARRFDGAATVRSGAATASASLFATRFFLLTVFSRLGFAPVAVGIRSASCTGVGVGVAADDSIPPPSLTSTLFSTSQFFTASLAIAPPSSPTIRWASAVRLPTVSAPGTRRPCALRRCSSCSTSASKYRRSARPIRLR
ncbi:hypothetical protein CDCA_CDCA19G4624 [Cyanidium caldarium]|uniref:SUI1 domain-containing protein n=1 Tax=Cyanidium caldarium TaxID=2771 RepID=A0AAV9J220_CYACA|nr:hypothetical protein CDCA_CDCA19G4624 [Cyanidium caldarium]